MKKKTIWTHTHNTHNSCIRIYIYAMCLTFEMGKKKTGLMQFEARLPLSLFMSIVCSFSCIASTILYRLQISTYTHTLQIVSEHIYAANAHL